METPVYSPVCMIYSQLTLSQIQSFLKENYSDNGDEHGPLRIMKQRDKETGEWLDTNRTVAVISEKLFNALVQDNMHKSSRDESRPSVDFRIVPFDVRDNNMPAPGFKKDFFIRLPDGPLVVEQVEKAIHEKMEPLVKFGLLSQGDYSVRIPLTNKSRDNGYVHTACFVVFRQDLPVRVPALVKACLDDTLWPFSTEERFRCFWARDAAQQAPSSVQQQKKPYYKTERRGASSQKKSYYKAESK